MRRTPARRRATDVHRGDVAPLSTYNHDDKGKRFGHGMKGERCEDSTVGFRPSFVQFSWGRPPLLPTTANCLREFDEPRLDDRPGD